MRVLVDTNVFLFDDAYHYTLANNNELVLSSFDHDFDRTDRKRKTPAEIIAEASAAATAS
jgi:hypothetical protein